REVIVGSRAATAAAQDLEHAGTGPSTTKTTKVTAAARTVTSTRSGHWSAPSTWGGLTPPGIGVSAVINHDVTITARTTVGDGSASTVLDVTNGTLTVIAAGLTIRGNATFGKYNAGKVVTRLRVESSDGRASGIELDGNVGVTPVVSVNDDTEV